MIIYNHMVVDSGLSEAQIDQLFRALADATRRDIVGRAADGELSVSALARNYDMSFAAVQKHVATLERAGLVSKHRHGREQHVHTQPGALAAVRDVLNEIEQLWLARLDRFGDALVTLSKPLDTDILTARLEGSAEK